jgi:anhydro-N-acetylmuramic acid kinase
MDIVRTAIGLMSGTSMDGIDVALLRTDGRGFIERGPFLGVAYDGGFRERLKRALDLARPLSDRGARPDELREIEVELTLRHADAVTAFLEKFGLVRGDIDVLGFHGQTVLHRPDDALTIQIGDGALLAERSGIPVVHDMRANDMVHGGQGAPLVPAYHAALAGRFQKDGQAVCFVNIGGISNLTYIGAEGRIAAFDSGPGNTLIDQWVEMHTGRTYDPGGEIAGRGQVVPDIAARYLGSPFFSGNIRRSLDRGDFKPLAHGEASLEDGARTLAHVAAGSIIKSAGYLPDRPSVYIVCGGGRLNGTIMAEFADMAGKNGSRVMSAEEAGFDGDAMEAEAWAYLAVRSLEGLPLTYPGTTGVSQPVSGGVLSEPER